jgi:hypothetical protein
MHAGAFQSAAILAVLVPALQANPVSRRATITGGGGSGRCTIEVTVDHAAEVEVSADMGLLTTISGQPAIWRRFQCNAPLPPKPVDFSFVRISGNRGTVRLLQDPRNTGGRAVISINDFKGGRGSYTFDLQWRGPGRDGWGGSLTAKAIRICQDSVTDRLDRDGYQYIHFERTVPVDNPGRNDWITGSVSGNRGFGTTWFSFSCSVDFNSGRVRSVDVRARY